MKKIWHMSLVIVSLILIDQFTKGAVQSSFFLGESIPVLDGLFNLTYVRNPGAAFGMGGTSSDWIRIPFFFILPIVACFVLMRFIWLTKDESNWLCWGYSLILSGAIGNLIDRISLNYVIDFLDFYLGKHHFPAFNVADSAITVGAAFLIIDFLFFQKKREAAEKLVSGEKH